MRKAFLVKTCFVPRVPENKLWPYIFPLGVLFDENIVYMYTERFLWPYLIANINENKVCLMFLFNTKKQNEDMLNWQFIWKLFAQLALLNLLPLI